MTTVRTIIFLETIGLMFSCSSNHRQQNSVTSDSTDFKTLDTAVGFSGYWVSEDYYNGIMEFKSPKKAQDGSQCVFIPDRTLKQTIMIYNFHEGGAFLKVLKNHDNYEMWEVQDDSLTQRLNAIEIISSTKIKIADKSFIKINAVPAKDDYLILEEMLFKGLYTTADSKTIEFKNNRQVSGLDNFHYYSPIIDYFDAGRQVDQVGLGNSEKDIEWFGFKFNKDTLELYKLNCLTLDSTDNRCVEVDYGQLTYKLWRKE